MERCKGTLCKGRLYIVHKLLQVYSSPIFKQLSNFKQIHLFFKEFRNAISQVLLEYQLRCPSFAGTFVATHFPDSPWRSCTRNRRYISNLEPEAMSCGSRFVSTSKNASKFKKKHWWPLLRNYIDGLSSVSGKLHDYTTIQPTAETYCFEQQSNKSSGPGCRFMDKSCTS